MVSFLKKHIVLAVLLSLPWLSTYAQPPSADSLKPTLNRTDTIDSEPATYIPTATFSNFTQLKEEAGKFGIGSGFACQSYYGIFYMCELMPYIIGAKSAPSQQCNILYKISGNDSTRANLILISSELHNPDYATQTLETLVNVVRKTLNMLGEPIPDGLRYAILSKQGFKGQTNKGYSIILRVYHSTFDAVEFRLDATGMD